MRHEKIILRNSHFQPGFVERFEAVVESRSDVLLANLRRNAAVFIPHIN